MTFEEAKQRAATYLEESKRGYQYNVDVFDQMKNPGEKEKALLYLHDTEDAIETFSVVKSMDELLALYSFWKRKCHSFDNKHLCGVQLYWVQLISAGDIVRRKMGDI